MPFSAELCADLLAQLKVICRRLTTSFAPVTQLNLTERKKRFEWTKQMVKHGKRLGRATHKVTNYKKS